MSTTRRGLALLLAVAACARGRTPPPAGDAILVDRPVPLVVENRYRFDVNVYVARENGGQRRRLGTVVAATSQTLQVPAPYVGSGGFRLGADPIGPSSGSTCASERVLVTAAGQRVVWTLESSLARSTVAVY